MALSTYAELQASIISVLSDRTDLSGRVPDWIVMFEAFANSKLRVAQMETTGTITLTAGTGTLPTDYLAWRRVYANSSPVRALEAVDPDWAILNYPDTSADTPQYFYITGSSIFTKPVCSSTLAMLYFQKIPALASNTTGNWLLTRAPDLYLYGSLIHAAPFLDDDSRLAVWGALRDAALNDLIESDKTTRFARTAARVRGPTP